MPPIVLETVAVVRSPYKDAASVPGGGACVRIEVDPRFERELEGVERSSHLIVVGYFHERGKGEPAAPRRWRHGRGKPCGAFASRCPDRPTPISMSVGRFLGRDGLALLVDHIDLVDGTPVLDLKPYVPGWDAVFSARRLRRVRQVEISDLDAYEFLALDLENHLGSDAALPPAKMALAAVLLAVKRLGLEPRDPRLTVSVNRCDVTTDALMGLLGRRSEAVGWRWAPRTGPWSSASEPPAGSWSSPRRGRRRLRWRPCLAPSRRCSPRGPRRP